MNPTVGDFYVIGGTLRRDAPSYVKRQADDDLYDGLSAGQFCYVLTSRQMGKSSLMVRAAVRLREDGVFVAVLDLTAIGQNVTPEQWYEGLLGLIGQQFDLEDELDDFWSDNKPTGPLLRWMRALREVVMTRRQGRIVIFVDEIDAVGSLPFSTDEFFAGIRELYNRRTRDPELNRLTFCLLGVATPTDLIRDASTTPFNVGRRIDLTDFTGREAAPLAEGLGRPAGVGDALLDRILHWTGGHPYLTQRLCRAVAEDITVNSKEGVDRLCESLFLSPSARERDDNLLFVRERILRSEVDRAGLLDLYLRAREHRRVKDDETNPLVSVLRLSGITRAVEEYLEVRNRIYHRVFDREWVIANMPDAELRRQRAAYRRGLLRAAAVACVILSALSLLAYSAWSQKRKAEREQAHAEEERVRADQNAQKVNETLAQLNVALAETKRQKEVAEERSQQALAASQRAEEKSREAEEQRRSAEAQRAEALRQRNAAEIQTALAQDNSKKAGAERDRAEAVSLRNLRLSYDADMNLAQQAWERGEVTRFLSLLTSYEFDPQDLEGGKDIRGFEWYYHWRLAHSARRTLKGHTLDVTSVAFSPDGRSVASGSYDRTVKVWDAATGAEVHTFTGGTGQATSIGFSPNGGELASGNSDGGIRIWDVATRQQVRVLEGHNGGITSLAFSPDGGRLISGSEDKTAKLWDTATGRELFSLEGHEGFVTSVAISPPSGRLIIGDEDDGARLATGSEDKTARLWNPATGKEMLRLRHDGPVASIAFSPDGRRLVTGCGDKIVRIWSTSSEQVLLTLRGHTKPVTSVAFSRDGRKLVTASEDNTIRIWNTVDGQEEVRLQGHGELVTSVAFSPDSSSLASASTDGTIKLWNAAASPETITLRHGDKVTWVAFSADGKSLASASYDEIVLWDMAAGQNMVRNRWNEGVQTLREFALSPDGTRLASVDSIVRLWDTAKGQEVYRFAGRRGVFTSVAFSPDGSLLATGSTGNTAELWQATTGAAVSTLEHEAAVTSVAFSPNGGKLLTGGYDGTVRLWDVATGQAILTRKVHGGAVTSVAFSPDGALLAVGSSDKTVRLLDAVSGKDASSLRGHEGPITCVTFSPGRGDRRLASASRDGTVKLWDLTTGREVLTLRHEHIVASVAFSPDGQRLASGGHDRTVKVWDAASGNEARASERPASSSGYVTFVPALFFRPFVKFDSFEYDYR